MTKRFRTTPRGFKNDALARDLWGELYDAIPKSVFAAAAWHLANIGSGTADVPGAAEKRFAEEYDALRSHGIADIPKWVYVALNSGESKP